MFAWSVPGATVMAAMHATTTPTASAATGIAISANTNTIAIATTSATTNGGSDWSKGHVHACCVFCLPPARVAQLGFT